MIRFAFAAILVFGAAGIVLAPAQVRAQEASVTRGELLVKRHCGGCHAAGRTGRSPQPAAPPLRELYQRYEPDMLAEALAEGLLTGHPAMPEFRFRTHDVRSIIRYLNAIQTRQRS